MTEWIPCTERLPDKDGHYLITFKRDKGRNGVSDATFRNEMRGKWYRGSFLKIWTQDSVIAWMPLPKPYQGEQSAKDK